MNIGMRCLALGTIVAAGLAAPAFGQPGKKPDSPVVNPEITRRGEGTRRSELNKLELKPFQAELWSKLSEWQNGPALSSADMKGKVVLVVTYASWNKNSVKTLDAAKKLADAYAKKDLIVVAVHDKDGWKDAEKSKAADGSKFMLALDAKNEFRKSLLANQDPEIYVIDRAGQLRFAVVAADAMEPAVKKLTDEKTEDAAKINDRIAEQAAKDEAARRKTIGASDHIDMTRIPELAFQPPTEAEYDAAKWPLPAMTDQQQNDYKSSGKIPPAHTVELPLEGWIPASPKTKGRATLTLFFHPDWGNPGRLTEAFDFLSDLQRSYGRDVAVVFAVSNIFEEKDFLKVAETDPEKMKARIKEFVKERKIEFSFVLDLENTLYDAARGSTNEEYKGMLLALGSSDSKNRFLAAPSGWGQLTRALDKVLEVDPGIKARRAAERRWLESNKNPGAQGADKK